MKRAEGCVPVRACECVRVHVTVSVCVRALLHPVTCVEELEDMYFYKSHGSETRHGDRGRRPDDTAEISTLYVKALLSYRRKCPKQEAGCVPYILNVDKHLKGHKDLTQAQFERRRNRAKRDAAMAALERLRASNPQPAMVSRLDLQSEDPGEGPSQPRTCRRCRDLLKKNRDLEAQVTVLKARVRLYKLNHYIAINFHPCFLLLLVFFLCRESCRGNHAHLPPHAPSSRSRSHLPPPLPPPPLRRRSPYAPSSSPHLLRRRSPHAPSSRSRSCSRSQPPPPPPSPHAPSSRSQLPRSPHAPSSRSCSRSQPPPPPSPHAPSSRSQLPRSPHAPSSRSRSCSRSQPPPPSPHAPSSRSQLPRSPHAPSKPQLQPQPTSSSSSEPTRPQQPQPAPEEPTRPQQPQLQPQPTSSSSSEPTRPQQPQPAPEEPTRPQQPQPTSSSSSSEPTRPQQPQPAPEEPTRPQQLQPQPAPSSSSEEEPTRPLQPQPQPTSPSSEPTRPQQPQPQPTSSSEEEEPIRPLLITSSSEEEEPTRPQQQQPQPTSPSSEPTRPQQPQPQPTSSSEEEEPTRPQQPQPPSSSSASSSSASSSSASSSTASSSSSSSSPEEGEPTSPQQQQQQQQQQSERLSSAKRRLTFPKETHSAEAPQIKKAKAKHVSSPEEDLEESEAETHSAEAPQKKKAKAKHVSSPEEDLEESEAEKNPLNEKQRVLLKAIAPYFRGRSRGSKLKDVLLGTSLDSYVQDYADFVFCPEGTQKMKENAVSKASRAKIFLKFLQLGWSSINYWTWEFLFNIPLIKIYPRILRKVGLAPTTVILYVGQAISFLEFFRSTPPKHSRVTGGQTTLVTRELRKLHRDLGRTVLGHQALVKQGKGLKLIAREDLARCQALARAKMPSLLEDIEKAAPRDPRTRYRFYGYLAAYLTSIYGHRTGVLTRMRVKEVKEAIGDDERGYLINVMEHKTVRKFGTAQLYLNAEEHAWFRTWLRLRSRAVPKNPYFFSSLGRGEAKDLVRYFRMAWAEMGLKGAPSFMDIRTAVSTYNFESNDKEVRHNLSSFMCHSASTQERFYALHKNLKRAKQIRDLFVCLALKDDKTAAPAAAPPAAAGPGEVEGDSKAEKPKKMTAAIKKIVKTVKVKVLSCPPTRGPGTPAVCGLGFYLLVQVQEEEEEEIKPKSTHTAGVPAPRQSVSQDHDSERLPEHRGSNVEIHQQSAPKGAPGLRQPFAVVVMGHRLSWSWDTGLQVQEEEEEEIKPKSTHTAGVPAPRQSVSQDHDSERLPEHRGSLGVRMLRHLSPIYVQIHQQSAPKGAPGLRQPFAVVVMGHRLSWSWDTGLQVQEEEEEEIKPKSTHTAGVPAPRQSVSQDHDSERLPEHRGSLGVRMLRHLSPIYVQIHQQSAPKGAPGLRQPFAVVVMGHRLSWSWDTGLQVQEEEEEEIKPKSTHTAGVPAPRQSVSQDHDSERLPEHRGSNVEVSAPKMNPSACL
ncbi:Proteoglycan 4 [Collichthys lucidus]|uniref:Proteoglycan 4 n=1 Tax=Collichthys lucidus TaxID=240159 RepID=A0A4U5TVT7_COLLU|nr:Proteoglycan 4 [Collichthys lucidus]